jgi:hypothetical protein
VSLQGDLDAIVKAAQELVKEMPCAVMRAEGEMGGLVLGSITSRMNQLAYAVRAAEQRWTLDEKGGLYDDGVYANVGSVFGGNDQLMKRIARLLNEDDAKGGS